MPFIIDGHNLIGQLPDIALDDPEDEAKLIVLLKSFSARTGKKIYVYFDRRSPGSQNPPASSGVRVRFISRPRSADEAIGNHLRRLGKEAVNWTVVSSDAQVQRMARRAGARQLSSNRFALLLHGPDPPIDCQKPVGPGSKEEIQEWEKLFGEGGKPA